MDERRGDAYPLASPPTVRQAPRLGTGALSLVVFTGQTAKTHRLAHGTTVEVGRAPEHGLTVARQALSRRHFRIQVGEQPSICDLGSLNGTFVNSVRLEPHVPVPLEIGALVEAGGVLFLVRESEVAVEAPAAPAAGGAGPAAAYPIVIEAPAMVRLHDLVGLVARSAMPVLVLGETGVGKEIVSVAVHERSPRAGKPLVRVNCAALPESLLESELFGYEKGAFTGAAQSKPGLIESADGGSFLLDEVGEMPLTTQAKLLRVLESGQVSRLGSVRPRDVDVRFIAATNRALPSLLAKGEFRRDLFYRLNGMTLAIPPLRERLEEIPGLARRFVALGCVASGRKPPSISEGALALLRAYPWPGNVRQLKNVVDRALALCTGDELAAEHVVFDEVLGADTDAGSVPAGDRVTLPHGSMRVDPEEDRKRILEALERAGGNQGRAAEILGVSRRTFMKWLDNHGVSRPRKGPPRSTGS